MRKGSEMHAPLIFPQQKEKHDPPGLRTVHVKKIAAARLLILQSKMGGGNHHPDVWAEKGLRPRAKKSYRIGRGEAERKFT